MKTNKIFKTISLLTLIVLIAATALCFTGCNKTPTTETPSAPVEKTEMGTGARSFALKVTDGEGTVKEFLVRTDKETVGDALQELKFIDGDESATGLYVKVVDGKTADYDKDGTYWAFYINGSYALESISATKIDENATYALTVEKA